ncbi:hypothetical protein HPB51_018778 [Rhipicephalus microplus]|uniref:Uncharacterized protein n=1 Tax=Rhipicephalus microplus TaxID=6941 RepID=A0A9J6DJ89_RHIMP|nr:hypothetical protein HPB51_018778 [Rhipicephalus microplus]
MAKENQASLKNSKFKCKPKKPNRDKEPSSSSNPNENKVAVLRDAEVRCHCEAVHNDQSVAAGRCSVSARERLGKPPMKLGVGRVTSKEKEINKKGKEGGGGGVRRSVERQRGRGQGKFGGKDRHFLYIRTCVAPVASRPPPFLALLFFDSCSNLLLQALVGAAGSKCQRRLAQAICGPVSPSECSFMCNLSRCIIDEHRLPFSLSACRRGLTCSCRWTACRSVSL